MTEPGGERPEASEAPRLRSATPADLPFVLRHRRGMFEAMGFRDKAQLDAMEQASAPFFARGLRDGTYRGFFAVDEAGRILAGGGVVLLEYQPTRWTPARGGPSWSTCTPSRSIGAAAWPGD